MEILNAYVCWMQVAHSASTTARCKDGTKVAADLKVVEDLGLKTMTWQYSIGST